MAVSILELRDPDDDTPEGACLFCTCSGNVFGRRFEDVNEADDFLQWLGCDPRKVDTLNLLEDAREAYDTAATIGFTGLLRGQWAVEQRIDERYEQHRKLTAAAIARKLNLAMAAAR